MRILRLRLSRAGRDRALHPGLRRRILVARLRSGRLARRRPGSGGRLRMRRLGGPVTTSLLRAVLATRGGRLGRLLGIGGRRGRGRRCRNGPGPSDQAADRGIVNVVAARRGRIVTLRARIRRAGRLRRNHLQRRAGIRRTRRRSRRRGMRGARGGLRQRNRPGRSRPRRGVAGPRRARRAGRGGRATLLLHPERDRLTGRGGGRRKRDATSRRSRPG